MHTASIIRDRLSEDACPSTRLANPTRQPPAIALLSDGASIAALDPYGRQVAVEFLLGTWMTFIKMHTGLNVLAVNIASSGHEDLRARLQRLPVDLAGVVVVDTSPDRCGTIRTWAQDRECPLFTQPSMTAVATTAALLTSLIRQGLPPERSHVVITGAATMPLLCGLLTASGVGQITQWDRRDAETFPLRRIAAHADAVIDLLGCAHDLVQPTDDRPGTLLITPDSPEWAVLALPTLLHAATTVSPTAMSMDTRYACALTLVAATPEGRLLPRPTPVTQSGDPGDRRRVTAARGGISWRQRSLRNGVIQRTRPPGIRPATSATSTGASPWNRSSQDLVAQPNGDG